MVRIPKPQAGPPEKYGFHRITIKEPLVLTNLSSEEAEKVRRAASKYACRRPKLRGRFRVRKVRNGNGGFTVSVYKERV